MSPTPHLSVRQPEKFSRAHLAIRLVLLILLSVLTGSHGWPGVLVYFGLPAAAALLISQHGRDRFLSRDARGFIRVLHWLLGFYAYLGLLTDRFPTGEADDSVRLEVIPSGEPTPGSAMMRLLTSIPAAIALWLLGIVGGILWVISAIFVLITESYPLAIFDFQCGVLRYQARFLAWHASLVDAYPNSMTEQTTLPGPTAKHLP